MNIYIAEGIKSFCFIFQIIDKIHGEDAAFNVCIMLRKGAPCNFTINAHSVAGVTGYKINFGDNTPVATFTDRTTVTPHTYAAVGTYSAVLTFVGPGTTVTKTVTVKEAIVNAVSCRVYVACIQICKESVYNRIKLLLLL